MTDWLTAYFQKYPLRFSVPKKEAAQVQFPRTEPKEQRALFQHLEAEGILLQDETGVRLPGWEPRPDERTRAWMDRLRVLFEETPLTPPRWSEAAAALNIPDREQSEIMNWFLRAGELVRLSDDVLLSRSALASAEETLRRGTGENSFTLAEARDLLGCPRKQAQLIMEYFDQQRLTRWDGEKRHWQPSSADASGENKGR